MINYSKEFFNRIVSKDTDCQMWHSFGGPCSRFLPNMAVQCIIGSSKFFLPVYLVKIALNRKRTDENYLKEQLWAYLKSIMYAATFGTTFIGVSCIITRICGVFYYILVCTGFLSGFPILIEHHESRGIDTLLLFNQCLEGFLNHAVNEKLIERTPRGETAVFMLASAVLMYLFKTQKTKKILNLWFYPVSCLNRRQTEVGSNSQSKCAHKDSCVQFGYKEAIKYFGIGYILEIVKMVIPRIFQVIVSPRAIFRVLVNKKNVLFGLFFGGYVAIYRYVLCLLTRIGQGERAVHSLIAGLLAGSAYRFKPNTQILIIGVVTILQLLSQRIKEAYDLPEDFPYYLIVFSACAGVLIHFRFMLSVSCPIYTRNMFDICTNNMSKKLQENITNFIRNAELKSVGTC